MDFRNLRALRAEGGEKLFFAAQQYAHFLWHQSLPARAILALDRALFCDLAGDESVLQEWPLPYKALRWVLVHENGQSFLGNPRISFQHIADRVRGVRVEIRCWRAWAAWHVVRLARPELPPDEKHRVTEPSAEETLAALRQHGFPGEDTMWLDAMAPEAIGLPSS